jgi:hypothetical protein
MGRAGKAPTERDRFWLDHEAKLAASEMTAKAYAAEHGLSLHAFYQARKRLRALGLLEAGAARRSPRPEKATARRAARPVAFSKVEIRSPRPSGPAFRLSLPGGAVLEWSGAELPPAVVDLVERLSAPR